jgi:hypothetical protein
VRRNRRQQRGALQERGGRGQAPAALRSPGRTLQLVGDLLVRLRRSLRPVPGAPIRIEPRISHLGQRVVDLLSLLAGGRPVGRRAHQRMPEPHLGAELDQPGLHRGRSRRNRDLEQPGRLPHQQRIAGRIRRRQLQQPSGLLRQRPDLPPEAFLDVTRQRPCARQPESTRQLRRRHSTRELEQRQRVPPGLGHDLVPHPGIQRAGQHRIEQRSCVALRQAFDGQLR